MEYVFIPLDKIKIVEKFIDDYPIYLDFKSFVKNKDEKLYKKLPLYLVCEEKIINNKRILTDLLTSNDLSFYLYGEYKEGLLVASKIADRVGITRSVIVNALRKFESAGVIESRSLGMKGTHIKILNDKLMEELKKLKNHQ